jgi:hypothetical protein
MTANDLPKFQELLLRTSLIYSKDVNAMHIDTFLKLLMDYDINDIEKAFYEHMGESRYFPTPAEIKERLPIQKHYITDEEIDGYLK